MQRLKAKTNKNKVSIAAIHLLPTLGFEGFLGMDAVVDAAKQDIEAVQQAGFDAIIIENNYDLPHEIMLEPHTVLFIREVLSRLQQEIKIPFGLSILWNDYKAAFALAAEFQADFIRVPVFVDTVQTDFGQVNPVAAQAKAYQVKVGAEGVEIFADIHVKHATILNTDTIEQSGANAVKAGADAVIATGRWTADSPQLDDLKALAGLPVVIGSGATSNNISELMRFADAVIVGTALKQGKNKVGERNIKSYSQRIDYALSKNFVERFNAK